MPVQRECRTPGATSPRTRESFRCRRSGVTRRRGAVAPIVGRRCPPRSVLDSLGKVDESVVMHWGKVPGPPEAIRFLEGPQPRRLELRLALGIFAEFIRGFRALHFVGPCVTVF